MFIDSKPVVIVYFTVTMNSTDMITPVNIADNVSDCYSTLLNLPLDLVAFEFSNYFFWKMILIPGMNPPGIVE